MRTLGLSILLVLATASNGEETLYSYSIVKGDTLIGISNRLLSKPRMWPLLQKLNRVSEPRRLQPGSMLQIPYTWLKTENADAVVSHVQGQAKKGSEPLRSGSKFTPGESIVTDSDGYVTLDLADGSQLKIQAASRVELERLQRYRVNDSYDLQIRLDKGRLESQVPAHSKRGPRYQVTTPTATAGVRGTEFRVGFEGDTMRTEVLTGAVAVSGAAATKQTDAVAVSAGFGTRARTGQLPEAPRPLLPMLDLSHVAALYERPMVRIAIAPVTGAQYYRAQVARDRQFKQVVAEAQFSQPEFRFGSLADGDYWLRGRAIDRDNLEGIDAVASFRLKARPEPPFLIAPAQQAKLRGTEVELQWSAAQDAARYRLQLSLDKNFTALLGERTTLELTRSAIALPPIAAGESRNFYWRIASIKNDGDQGPYSDIQTFRQLPPASAPDPAQVSDDKLTLRWRGEPGQSFLLQIARDAQFKEDVQEYRTQQDNIDLPRPEPGTYYARVQATDNDGWVGAFSGSQKITVPHPPFPWWILLIVLLPLL